MADTNISAQGYLYGTDPKATNPFYKKAEGGGGGAPDKYVKSAKVVTGESSDSLKLETVTVENDTQTTTDSTEWNIRGPKGDPGEQGPEGPQGPAGDPVSKAGLVDDVTITNEDGVYTFKQTKYDETGTATTESEIGTVEVPKSTPGIVEVKDSVVENNTDGYDFHTITETENDGTENEVGKFYIAQKQELVSDNSYEFLKYGFDAERTATKCIKYVDQSGNISSAYNQYMPIMTSALDGGNVETVNEAPEDGYYEINTMSKHMIVYIPFSKMKENVYYLFPLPYIYQNNLRGLESISLPALYVLKMANSWEWYIHGGCWKRGNYGIGTDISNGSMTKL